MSFGFSLIEKVSSMTPMDSVAPSRPAPMSPGQRRDLRLLALLRGTSFLGDGVALITLYLRLSPSGHAWEIAALSIASSLPLVVLSALAGHVVDRVRLKPLLVGLGLLEGVVCAGLGVWHSLIATLILMALLNCGVAFSMPGYATLMVAVAGEENVSRAQALLQAAQGVATVLGPVLGGVLVGATGQSWPLYLDAASFAVCALGTIAISQDRVPGAPTSQEHARMTAGLRHIFSDGLLRPLVVTFAIFMVALGMVNVAEVFFVTRTLRASATLYGAVGASFAVGTIVGSLAAGRLNTDVLRLVRTSLIAIGAVGLSIGAIGLVTRIEVVYPLLAVAGVAVGVVNVAATTLFTLRSAEEIRGRVFAALNAVFVGSELGSTAFGGLILILVAPRTVFQIAGIASTLVVLIIGPISLRASRGAHSHENAQGA